MSKSPEGCIGPNQNYLKGITYLRKRNSSCNLLFRSTIFRFYRRRKEFVCTTGISKWVLRNTNSFSKFGSTNDVVPTIYEVVSPSIHGDTDTLDFAVMQTSANSVGLSTAASLRNWFNLEHSDGVKSRRERYRGHECL